MESSPQFEGILIAVKTVGVPFLVATLGLLWASRNAARDKHRLRTRAGATLFVLPGMLAGFAAMNHGQWQFPPSQAMDWMPILALLPAVVLHALDRSGAGKHILFAAQALVVALAVWVLLPPAVLESGFPAVLAWLLPVTAVWLAIWRYLDVIAVPERAGVALTFAAGVLGFVVSLGGSIMIGGVGISIMGALAGWLVVSLVKGWIPLSRALLGSVTILFGSVLVAAYFYAEISAPLLGVVLLGLFSVQLARFLPKADEHRRLRDALFNGLAAAPPLLAAAGFAVWSYLKQANAYY